jgi:hypothetical protein
MRGGNCGKLARPSSLFGGAIAGLIVLIAPAAVQAATTITVDTTSTFSETDHCTLSQAINLAVGTGATGTCAKTGSGALTIEFDSSLADEAIVLRGILLPTIRGGTNLTIVGPNSSSPNGITISGEGSPSRDNVGLIRVEAGATLSLQNLTLTKGSSTFDGIGGAITNDGSLTIANSSIVANLSVDLSAKRFATKGGAIINGPNAKLTITNSTFSGNQAQGGGLAAGGAIDNRGRLTVTGSTFSANKAVADGSTGIAEGGAIYNEGDATLTISNSTLVANQANGSSPMALGEGGAIFNSGATLIVTNSTLSANQASSSGSGLPEGGAIFSSVGATSTITNATFFGNKALGRNNKAGRGGAIFIPKNSMLTLKGNILAKSFGGNCQGPLVDGGYNLSDDGSACGFSGTSRNNVADIDLATGLGNNGGPTQTIAITSVMSAAVDLIPPLDCPPTDQRGFIRPAPGQARCDAGAFELGAMPPP